MIRMTHLRLVAIVAMFAPLPAYAQVIEIDAAGDATTYDGPTMSGSEAVLVDLDGNERSGTVDLPASYPVGGTDLGLVHGEEEAARGGAHVPLRLVHFVRREVVQAVRASDYVRA